MLQLALAALLAGSLITGGLDGDKDKDKDKANAQQPIESILVPRGDDARVGVTAEDEPINDTYAFGRSERIPFKVWLGYGYGRIEDAYLADGEQLNDTTPLDFGEITAQRAFLGAQLHVINLANFSVGVGGQLNMAKNEVESAVLGNRDSDFTLSNVKAYGMIRGRALGIHGGYIFDIQSEDIEPFDEDLPADAEAPVTDEVNAWFVGVDFDYPSERFRVFAGIDYFNRDELASGRTSGSIEDDELVVFNAGAGIKFGFVEIGAAALLRTNLAINRLFEARPEVGNPLVDTGGGHQGSIAPYIVLSPQAIPVSLSVKGAVLGEYADYGYSIGGASDFVTTAGVTGTLTFGF